jgi:hypothetical protein
MLKMPVRVLREHPRIEFTPPERDRDGSRAGDPDLSRVWPLVGLLLEEESKGEHIDFLHPRKAPDLGARTRQRRLLAAAAIVIIGGAAYTFMRQDLQSLGARAQSLAQKSRNGDADFARQTRDGYRLTHLQQWQSVHVDWLDHAMFLAKVAPPPEQIVLDSWTGTLDFAGVQYDARRNRWSADHQATIVIEGEARNRATADAFRGALIQNPIYVAKTTGADARGGKRMPFGFTYRLQTRASTPEDAPIDSSNAEARPVGERKPVGDAPANSSAAAPLSAEERQ